jgi:hypothetical protein
LLPLGSPFATLTTAALRSWNLRPDGAASTRAGRFVRRKDRA